MIYLLLLFWLSLVGADFHVPLHNGVAPRTTLISIPTARDPVPIPTEKPSISEWELRKRVDSIPANICGWFSGSGYSKTLWKRAGVFADFWV